MAKQNHENLGDVVVSVGSYDAGQGQTKSTNRNIGTLWQTTDDKGGKRFWLKMNAEILQPSLFALVRAEGMKKGDDKFIANVFAPRNQPRKTASQATDAAGDAPQDDVPF